MRSSSNCYLILEVNFDGWLYRYLDGHYGDRHLNLHDYTSSTFKIVRPTLIHWFDTDNLRSSHLRLVLSWDSIPLEQPDRRRRSPIRTRGTITSHRRSPIGRCSIDTAALQDRDKGTSRRRQVLAIFSRYPKYDPIRPSESYLYGIFTSTPCRIGIRCVELEISGTSQS